MRLVSAFALTSALAVAFCTSAFALPRAHRSPTAPKLQGKHSTKPAPKPASQHAIDSERATQIQTALIKSGYLSGSASGAWDAQTESAMQKLQEDNGWQTKIVPDARAIIKLGLGPNTAAMAAPEPATASLFNQP
jgi:peptidoglycan hydrolase-like protein with peptidoglycan-binding domain